MPSKRGLMLLADNLSRLAGSYQAISHGGQTADALVDFTGGVSEFVRLSHCHGRLSSSVENTQLFKVCV